MYQGGAAGERPAEHSVQDEGAEGEAGQIVVEEQRGRESGGADPLRPPAEAAMHVDREGGQSSRWTAGRETAAAAPDRRSGARRRVPKSRASPASRVPRRSKIGAPHTLVGWGLDG